MPVRLIDETQDAEALHHSYYFYLSTLWPPEYFA